MMDSISKSLLAEKEFLQQSQPKSIFHTYGRGVYNIYMSHFVGSTKLAYTNPQLLLYSDILLYVGLLILITI